MRETALTFGPANLVGILTEPDHVEDRSESPAFVILNSGILHRPGASRIYVKIARALADVGFTSLRFDFSGIGDSEVRKDDLPIEDRFVQETKEAMDYLAEITDSDRFVLGGLCSGADGAFWTALSDERVVGLWQIDAFSYRTLGYYRARFGPKLLNAGAWINAVRVRMPSRGSGDDSSRDEVFVKPEYRRVFPPKREVEAGLGELLERGVHLYFFFTGGLPEYLHPNQHADAFRSIRLGERATIRYEGESDHMVTGFEHQEILVQDLKDWAQTVVYPAPVIAGR